MAKKGDIVRYTAEELEDMHRRGEDRTDWAKVDSMTEEALEASIAADPDDTHEDVDWMLGFPGMPHFPQRKKDVHFRLDADLIDWFRSQGRGYQTRINAVLRAFVATKRKQASAEAKRKNAA